ncbi:hypothetical protein, partial [Fundidesulfovibrio putealis]|uniref:hypothetical protein n=1 Tax=Fundidesulfovibrio putealis TaxID=270496 RepID=UPI00196A1536
LIHPTRYLIVKDLVPRLSCGGGVNYSRPAAPSTIIFTLADFSSRCRRGPQGLFVSGGAFYFQAAPVSTTSFEVRQLFPPSKQRFVSGRGLLRARPVSVNNFFHRR